MHCREYSFLAKYYENGSVAMRFNEFSPKPRYSLDGLSKEILRIWEKDARSPAETRWLKLLSVNTRIKSMLLSYAKRHRHTTNLHDNNPFLDNAAECARAYLVLEEVQALLGQHFIAGR